MAMFIYISSEWFTMGCRVIKVFYDMITSPLMKLLGIYEFSRVNKQIRNWEGIKEFSEIKKIEIMVNKDS